MAQFKKRTALILGISVFSFILHNSCRRFDTGMHDSEGEKVARFFGSQSSDPSVNAIKGRIYRQESKKPFVSEFVNWAGYPVWNKAAVIRKQSTSFVAGGGGGGELLFIPFVTSDTSRIGAILLAKVDGLGDTTLKMIYDWDYNKLGYADTPDSIWNARNIFHIFTLFERDVLGHTKFKLFDDSLLNGDFARSSGGNVLLKMKDEPREGRSSFKITTSSTVCTGYDLCYDESGENYECPRGGCYEGCIYWLEEIWYCSLIFTDININLPTIGGGSGGGSGPDRDWNSNPCQPTGGLGDPCASGGGSGWIPVDEPMPDQVFIDS